MRIKPGLSSLTIDQIKRSKTHDFIALETYITLFNGYVNIIGFAVCALEAYFSGK